MKHIQTFESFLNESELNEANKYGGGHTYYFDFDELKDKFAKDYLTGKYTGLYVDLHTFPLYDVLAKKRILPEQGKYVKSDIPVWYYGIIKDKSYFSSTPTKEKNVWYITQNISNNAAILEETLVRYPKKMLFIRDKGVYQLGIASEEQRVPAEYQQYLP